MDETAQHTRINDDPASVTAAALEGIDLQALSFIQLRRLQKTLTQTTKDIEQEIARRSEADGSGDTVRTPAPTL